MTATNQNPVCPHCHEPLTPFELPPNTGWQEDFHLACFNDDCPYYRRGWEQLTENYAVRASYRYRVDPTTGSASPLAVWSPDALKDRILEAEVTGTASEPDESEEEDR